MDGRARRPAEVTDIVRGQAARERSAAGGGTIQTRFLAHGHVFDGRRNGV